jgi:hypothetical protein
VEGAQPKSLRFEQQRSPPLAAFTCCSLFSRRTQARYEAGSDAAEEGQQPAVGRNGTSRTGERCVRVGRGYAMPIACWMRWIQVWHSDLEGACIHMVLLSSVFRAKTPSALAT